MSDPTFDLSSTHVHLGLGATAVPIDDWEWTPEFIQSHLERFADDGDEGRLVTMFEQGSTWGVWERHPAGEELVLLLSGRVDVVQDIDGEHRLVEMHPGRAVINPRNVWHTAIVHEPGMALFVTPGRGTEHRSTEEFSVELG